MRKFFGIFWGLFAGYFVFVHPAIIYYSVGFDTKNLAEVNPVKALCYLGLSAFLWVFVFALSLRIIIKYTFIAQRNINQLNQSGKRLSGQIVESKQISKPNSGRNTKAVLCEFKNLQNEKIRHRMQINDAKPQENRFRVGNQINLRVDERFKKNPYVIIEGTQSRINWIFFVLWFFLVAGVVYYGYFSYQLENRGYGWRFLSLEHPLIVSAGVLIFMFLIFGSVGKLFVLTKTNTATTTLSLKFRGKKAIASIINARQTGTYINEQPEVAFKIQFADACGKVHETELKKIVSLMEIGTVGTEKERTVFYDPQAPQKVMFEQDLTDEL